MKLSEITKKEDMSKATFMICGMNTMYTSRVEKSDGGFSFTVFSPRHGECGIADSRTGYGETVAEAMEDCEWAYLIDAPKE